MRPDQSGQDRWIGVTPGTGTAVVGRHVAVLLAAGPDHPLVGELWTVVGEEDAGFDGALAVLGAAGFDRLPDLVMAGWEDDSPRVVVRGDVAVAVGAEDGREAREITGAEVHSWAEHTVPGDGSIHMRLGPLPRGAAASGSFVVDRGRLPAVALSIPTRLGPHNDACQVDRADRDGDGEALSSTILVGGLPERPPPLPTDPVRAAAADPSPTPLLEVPSVGGPAAPRKELGVRGEASAADPVAPTTDGHLLAVRCARGHLNPLHGHRCRGCDAPLSTDAPELVAHLDLGVFRFSTGAVVTVSRPMVIGRAPRVAGEVRGEMPDLVPVPSPDQDISRTHLEVRLEGWQVLVVEMGSTNGTTVTLPGREPQRLRPDQPYPLPVGAVVSLADEVEFSFEVEP